MSYWIHPDAEVEFSDAAVYDATQASRAIAEAFLAEFERVLDLSRTCARAPAPGNSTARRRGARSKAMRRRPASIGVA